MTGSLRQRGPDTWQVRVSIGIDPRTGKYLYTSKTVRGGKRAAQRAAADMASEVAKGGLRPKVRGTVHELLDTWLAHIEGQGRADTTLVRYRSVVATHIVPVIGRLRVEQLTPADLDAMYARERKQGLGPLSIRKTHAIMSAALHQAVRWGWIDRNPADRASPPPARQADVVVPERSDVRHLLELCEESNPDLASLVYVAAMTGLRRGELCGLQWEDLDTEGMTVTVTRSISDVPESVTVKGTKTHQSRRIALDPTTVEVLARHRTLCEGRAKIARLPLLLHAFVFSQEPDGSEPYRPRRITASFKLLRNKAGLPGVTFHSLRHFSATTLAASGVGVRTIAGRLGHANPSVTLRTYSHFLEPADREAAALMAGVADDLRPRPRLER